MLKRRILASSMASVMALTSIASVAFADEKAPYFATKKDLVDYVAEMTAFKDKDLNDYGQINAEKFETVLTYVTAVSENDKASANEVAVAYMMLQEAKDRLVIHDYEELQALIKECRPTYDTDNILNEDVDGTTDYIYDDDAWYDFTGAFDSAEACGTGDRSLITDCYIELEDKYNNLENHRLASVTKSQLNTSLKKLDNLLQKEFIYNAWTRGSVSGTGTAYDTSSNGNTYAWGVLYYHVASAHDGIETQFGKVLNYVTIKETTNPAIVKAYNECELAIKILEGYSPDSMKTYSSAAAVEALVKKTYKDKIVCSDAFAAALAAIIDSGAKADVDFTKPDKDDQEASGYKYNNPAVADMAAVTKEDIAAYYKSGALKLYADVDIKLDGGKLKKADPGDEILIAAGASYDILKLAELDLVYVLASQYGQQTGHDTGAYDNGVWDTKKAGSDPKDKVYTDIGDDKLTLATVDLDTFGTAGLYNFDKLETSPFVLLDTAVEVVFNGGAGSYASGDKLGYGFDSNGDDETQTNRQAQLKKIAYSEKLSTAADKKASNAEWNVIGQYLELALKDTFPGVSLGDDNHTRQQLRALITEASAVSKMAEDCFLFSARQQELEYLIELATKTSNFYLTNGAKLVSGGTAGDDAFTADDEAVYTELQKCKEALETEFAAFEYGFDDIADYVAMVAANVNNKSSAVAGNDALAAKAREVAYLLSEIEDLNLTGDKTLDDLAVDVETFDGYNRLYTAADKTKILTAFDAASVDDDDLAGTLVDGTALTIAEVLDENDNPTHKALKNAFAELQDMYEKAVAGESGLLGDANNDGSFDVRDVTTVLVAIAEGKEKDLPAVADYNKDGTVNVFDVTEMLKALLG